MTGVAPGRASVVRSLRVALVMIAITGLGLALAEAAALAQTGFEPLWILLLFPATGLVYAGAGLVAWRRRPSNRLGPIMTAGGVAWIGAGLVNTNLPGLVEIGQVVATVPLAVVLHLLHAFPSGRLRGRASTATVVAGYVISIVLQAPSYVFVDQGELLDSFLVVDDPGLARSGGWVQRIAGIAVVAITMVILVQRLRTATMAQRRVLAPLFSYGVVAVLVIPVGGILLDSFLVGPPAVALQVAVLAGVPIAFTLGVLRGGFARTSEIDELGAWLGAGSTARPTLVEVLRTTLGDPSIELSFSVDDGGRLVDASGHRVIAPQPGSDRGTVPIDLGGRPVGAITYDAGLIADADLVRAAGRVIAIELDRERLTAELIASREAVRESRARLVEAADLERRRIAQDLHDGLQAQLVLLGLRAGEESAEPGVPASTRHAFDALRAGIDTAAADLRQLVHGVMPGTLVDRGLYAAIEDLVDRMPVPTSLELDGAEASLPPLVESTAYFVVVEALTNAIKHARAGELTVRLGRDDDRLRVEVRDDGAGGAAIGTGLGLGGLADRVDVLGGRLQVESARGRGTRLVAELPCAS